MMKMNCFTALALSSLVLLSPRVEAQSGRIRTPVSERATHDDKDTVRLRAEEVLLPISVRSDTGKLPTFLDRFDFIVSEDGKRQQVTSVMRTPANILLIIDTSGEVLTRKNINLNRELALKIIDSLGDEDQAAIVTYSDKVTLISGWTKDRAALRAALNENFKPGLEGRFYESLKFAAEEVLPKVSGRRSVVLLTDGVDSDGARSFSEALAGLNRARATVYVAGHNKMLLDELRPIVFNKLSWFEMIDPQVRKRYNFMRRYAKQLEAAEVVLADLAQETGGAIWNPEKREDFPSLTPKIVEEIGTEYVVAYSSERDPRDREFHSVKVFVTRRDLKVRSRRGVYANPGAGN
ncbi:MAG TPA: VWA domain-containing protein [Blastocatellia bacterium]|jgi:VWFA-related protein|nr:VWA domain-containing protein [Blastocatellia bacterium]